MRTILLNTPFFRLFLFLVGGIVSASFFNGGFFPFLILLLIGLSLLLVFFLLDGDKKLYGNWIFGVSVFFLFFAVGGVLSCLRLEKNRFEHEWKRGVFCVELLENPIEKPRSMLCRVKMLSFADSLSQEESSGKAVLYLEKDSLSSLLQRNDRLLVRACFSEPRPLGNPEEFDYGTYLRRKGFGATAYAPSGNWMRIGSYPKHSVFSLAEQSRAYLLSVYKKFYIEGDEFGMLAALTLGYKDALTPELRESFSTTGAMHVLAVSGLHVGILYFVLGWMLGFMGKCRTTRFLKPILLILLLWIYAFITGLSPSVTRATLMFSLMAFAQLLNRQSQIYNTIFFSAFALLLVNPDYLFDVGFQLSYSAVLSIVYFQPKLSALWTPHGRVLKWIWDLACVSLVAQLGTAPFAVFYFHQIPNYFLLSNFVVIPAASIIIYSAVALFSTAWIPYVGGVVAFLLDWILKLFYRCISFIEHLPYAVSMIWIDSFQLILLYAAVLLLAVYVWRKSFSAYCCMLICLAVFLGVRVQGHYASLTAQQAVVFKSRRANVVNFVSGGENVVFTTDSVEAKRLAEVFWLKNRVPKPLFLPDSVLSQTAVVCNGERYLILTRSVKRQAKVSHPLETDVLVVGRRIYADSTLFSDFFWPKQVVVAENVPFYTKQRIEKLVGSKH